MIGLSRIQNTIASAIEEANAEYSRLTGGLEWISDRGVESFLAYFVGRRLKKYFARSLGNVFIEVSMKEVREHLKGHKIIGRPGKHFYSGNRIDVVVTDRRLNVTGVVELKRNEFTTDWAKDIERVTRLVSRAGSIRFGCFALFLAESEEAPHIGNSIGDVNEYIRGMLRQPRAQQISLQSLKPLCSKPKKFDGVRWRYAIAVWTFVKKRK